MKIEILTPRNPKKAKSVILLKAENMKELESFLCCLPFGFVQEQGSALAFPKDFKQELIERILKNGWSV